MGDSQKNLRAHKNKIGTPLHPPPKKKTNTPPKTKNFMGMEAFLNKKNFQAPIKLVQPFPAPELQAKKFTDTRFFFV